MLHPIVFSTSDLTLISFLGKYLRKYDTIYLVMGSSPRHETNEKIYQNKQKVEGGQG